MHYGMYMQTAALVLFAGNNFAVTATASFDMSSQFSGYDRNVCMSMRGPSGWPTPVGATKDGANAANFQFISCGIPGKAQPTPFMRFADLPTPGSLAIDGQEFSILMGSGPVTIPASVHQSLHRSAPQCSEWRASCEGAIQRHQLDHERQVANGKPHRSRRQQSGRPIRRPAD
jgi:hypothetical protein